MSIILFCVISLTVADDDLLIADFEQDTYGSWKVEGEAFGPGPARGTLPGQMVVEGFEGRGLVNSFFHGDGTTGRLTSPPFRIERKFINFLIGGGKHAETSMRLIVDDKVVRSATGPNDKPGGSERLDWNSWDVSDLQGREAILQIVDQRTGGWGHINVDHILQSNRSRQAALVAREITTRYGHLQFPVKNGAPKRRVQLLVDGKTIRDFEIELAESAPDFWVACDTNAYRQRPITIQTLLPADSEALNAVFPADELRTETPIYEEKLRPQFHFTARRGWLNDPNGLVYEGGKYHLFFQHNPYGKEWGNMHWGHAVSDDLVRWREQPISLFPRQFGDWCFSGSGFVDHQNTSGFAQNLKSPLMIAYTSTGRGECIAYSHDGGATFHEYSENPVVQHAGRDPKVIWHGESRRWIMAVYDEPPNQPRGIAFHSSPDLKQWTFESRIEDFFECPDLFQLSAVGNKEQSRWVLYGADGKYVLGQFDGHRFVRDSGKHQLWFGNFYAAQTYSDVPDGRRVQIGWGSGITFPGMPFNQQMTIACELKLRQTPNGPRLFAHPVDELKKLRRSTVTFEDLSIPTNDRALTEVKLDTADIELDLEVGSAREVGLVVRGEEIIYSVEKGELRSHGQVAPLIVGDERLRLRVLVDRGSLEIFAQDGQVAMSIGVIPPDEDRSLKLVARGGTAQVTTLEVSQLGSIWED